MTPGFGIISQGAALMHPGKDHLMVFSCQGKMPKSMDGKPYKVNMAFNVVALFSVLCYLTTVALPYVKRLRNKTLVESRGTPSSRISNLRKENVGYIFR